jgi:hypothetical protein
VRTAVGPGPGVGVFGVAVLVRSTGSVSHSLTIEGRGGVDSTSGTVDRGRSTTFTVALQAGECER